MSAVTVSASAGTHTLKWHRKQTSLHLASQIYQLVCTGPGKYALEERPKPSLQHPIGALCALHAQPTYDSRQERMESLLLYSLLTPLGEAFKGQHVSAPHKRCALCLPNSLQ